MTLSPLTHFKSEPQCPRLYPQVFERCHFALPSVEDTVAILLASIRTRGTFFFVFSRLKLRFVQISFRRFSILSYLEL